jgi:hypothetical protein
MRGRLSKIQQFLADNVVEGCLEPEAGLNALYRLALLDPDLMRFAALLGRSCSD